MSVPADPSQYEEFHLDAYCIKCGYRGDGHIEYRLAHHDAIQEEHLLRTCKRCGYSWPQKVIDQ